MKSDVRSCHVDSPAGSIFVTDLGAPDSAGACLNRILAERHENEGCNIARVGGGREMLVSQIPAVGGQGPAPALDADLTVEGVVARRKEEVIRIGVVLKILIRDRAAAIVVETPL